MAASESPLAEKVAQLQASLLKKDPHQLASQTNTSLHQDQSGSGYFEFKYWENPVHLSTDDYVPRDPETQQPLAVIHQAMIGYYFDTSRGSPASQGWISFSELPDGQFYTNAFQSYTGKKILACYGTDYQRFEQKCREICGQQVSFADGAFRYQILPQAAAMAVYWRGDQDFPPRYRILFDDMIRYHLPTDGCAILGSMLTGRLIN